MEDAALAAGLKYVSDTDRGIRRRRNQCGFDYIGANGRKITSPNKIKRINDLAIPPAWTEVWICSDRNGHIQATGRDAKGRKQYRYHSRYRNVRDETKFDRMVEFSKLMPTLRDRVEKDLSLPGLPRRRVLAAVVRLLEKTLIRVGNQAYARENRSYGLTTLQDRHVEISGSQLRFEFVGKSGVMHTVAINDLRLARLVQRCQSLPGQELFQYIDDSGKRQVIDSGDINEYLQQITGSQITAKDFRTFAGTIRAAVALRDLGPPKSKKDGKANVVRAIDEVAEHLGNTRDVCRKYYVHPQVVERYLKGEVAETPPEPTTTKRRRKSAKLRRDEEAVLAFLDLGREGEA